MIDLNALLGRRVEYYEYPWAIEARFGSARARFRSWFQAPDVGFVFSKSMPRSGHRFLTGCLKHYFGPRLHYCGFYRPDCCHGTPCSRPHNAARTNRYFLQKSHDFGFRDPPKLKGKYLIQYRSPIPRLQSNYDLSVARGTSGQSKDDFLAFAERETAYFINFYRKWIATPRPNALAVAYEDLIDAQERTLAAVASFIQGDATIDAGALARTLAQVPVGSDSSAGSVRDPMQHAHYDPELFASIERQVAAACGRDRIRFHFI
ncbi:MAG: hypothetical protein WBB88_06285 [Methyloceanibacter sp.]